MIFAKKSMLAFTLLAVACSGSACSAEPEQSPPAMDFQHIKGQYPSPPTTTTAGNEEAPVGSCVRLTGPGNKAHLLKVDCDSDQSNYIVVQRVKFPTECIYDADRQYYQNGPDGEWTACLDLAWRNSDCLSIGDYDVKRVSCDIKSPEVKKPVKILTDVIDINQCSDAGFPHPVRRFTVCTETQK